MTPLFVSCSVSGGKDEFLAVGEEENARKSNLEGEVSLAAARQSEWIATHCVPLVGRR